MSANDNPMTLRAELTDQVAFIRRTLGSCAEVLEPGDSRRQDCVEAIADLKALAAAVEDAERLANAATVQVTPDPSSPTFDFDFGDMGAAMASLPPGTEYVRIVPVAAIDAARA